MFKMPSRKNANKTYKQHTKRKRRKSESIVTKENKVVKRKERLLIQTCYCGIYGLDSNDHHGDERETSEIKPNSP